MLEAINKKTDVLSMLHKEIKHLRTSLEFIGNLQRDNAELKHSVEISSSQMDTIRKAKTLNV